MANLCGRRSTAKPLLREYARNTARQKSQTPVITAFGFECLVLSDPKVAAEGLEPPTRGL